MSKKQSTKDNNVEYWKKREKQKLDKGLRDVKIVEREMAKEYKKAMENINKEISYLFDKYSKDNQLTYAEANKLLNGTQYKEFKTDLKSYIKEIEATGDELLLQELNTLSMKSRISRLEEIYYQCDKYINELSKTTENSLKMLYSGTVMDNYYQSLYDIHKYIGVGTSFAKVDNDMVRDILSLPWSGKNYSERIWSNRTKLKNIVKENITQMVIQGKSSRDIAKDLATKMDADYKNALRLVNTEHSYVMSEATAKAFEETDVEKYQFLATLDKRTSEKCQQLDLKVFDLKDRAIGVNASPMHPNCRSTEIPYLDEEELSTRFARDKNGKGIEVPSNMTYKEWQEAFNIEDISKSVGKVDKSKTFDEKIKNKIPNKNNKPSNNFKSSYKGIDVDRMPKEINRSEFKDRDDIRKARNERKEKIEALREEAYKNALNRPRKYNDIDKATKKLKDIGFKEVHLDNVSPLLYDDIVDSYEYSLSKIPKLKEYMHYLGDNTGLDKLYNNKEFKDVSVKQIMEFTGKDITQARRYYSTTLKKDLLGTLEEGYLSANNGMMMNSKKFKDYKNAIMEHFDNLDGDYLFKSDGTIQSVFTHEIGHNVDRMLRLEYNVKFDDFVSANSKLLQNELSEYGTTNAMEAFAELYSNYIHCPIDKQNQLTRNFGEWLEDKLKVVK